MIDFKILLESTIIVFISYALTYIPKVQKKLKGEEDMKALVILAIAVALCLLWSIIKMEYIK